MGESGNKKKRITILTKGISVGVKDSKNKMKKIITNNKGNIPTTEVTWTNEYGSLALNNISIKFTNKKQLKFMPFFYNKFIPKLAPPDQEDDPPSNKKVSYV